MAKVGRNDPCPCGSGRKAKRCCAIERGPSEQSLARAYLNQIARAALLELGPVGALADDDFDDLCARLSELPRHELSLQLELPKLIPPALERLLGAMERDDQDAGEAPFHELLDKLDTEPARAQLARAIVALRGAGRLERRLAAAALVDLASGSRELFAASLLEAAAVRAGIAPTPGGLQLAA